MLVVVAHGKRVEARVLGLNGEDERTCPFRFLYDEIAAVLTAQRIGDAHRARPQRRGGQTGRGLRVLTHDAFERRVRSLTLDQIFELLNSRAG